MKSRDKGHNNLPLGMEITQGSLLGRSQRNLLTRNRKEKLGKTQMQPRFQWRKKMPERGKSGWMERWNGHQSLGAGGGGVTCQVMHQIFNKMSHYGVGCYNNHHQAD